MRKLIELVPYECLTEKITLFPYVSLVSAYMYFCFSISPLTKGIPAKPPKNSFLKNLVIYYSTIGSFIIMTQASVMSILYKIIENVVLGEVLQ